MSLANEPGYSATVDLQLVVQGEHYQLTQVGRDYCELNAPASFHATRAEVVVTIDGQEERTQVEVLNLPENGDRRVEFRILRQD